jgi:uncharacterized membrane protein
MRFPSFRYIKLSRGERKRISSKTEKTNISNHRIDTLVDGFFAIALTLLILDIKTFHVESDAELIEHLITLLPKFFTYFLSFTILGLLWFEHQMVSHYVARSDRTHIWLNLIFLMPISLIPFSASLLGENISHPAATTFYGVNLFVTGLIKYLDWEYITRKNRLIDEKLNRKLVRSIQKTFLLVALSYAIGIEASFYSIPVSITIYSLATLAGALRMNDIFHQSHEFNQPEVIVKP